MTTLFNAARLGGKFDLLFPELAEKEEALRLERAHAEAMAELKQGRPSEHPEPRSMSQEGATQATQEEGNPQGVAVTLPHMNKALEKVFQIMWDNWRNTDPRRMPKQVNIAREIDKAMGWSPYGNPEGDPSRCGKSLAKIIKPDGLPDD